MSYQFDLRITKGKFEVQIDSKANYGYFEHGAYGDELGGGLWFENKEIVDYDGVYELPKHVIEAVRELGYLVGEDYE